MGQQPYMLSKADGLRADNVDMSAVNNVSFLQEVLRRVMAEGTVLSDGRNISVYKHVALE